MALVALLVIALVCLAVGLVLPSVAWLIASLIATAGAGFLLVKARSTILAPRAAGPGVDAVPADQAAPADQALPADPPAPADEAVPADQPAHTDQAPPADQPAHTDRDVDATSVLPRLGEVAGVHDEPAARAEPPDGQAAAPAAGPDDVWVIDGRPRYHVASCVIIQGQDAEPIPFEQAVEDGFMPCSLCEPQLARAAAQEL